MPDDGPPIPEAGSLRRGRFTYFPVVPGRLEFSIEVRQAILRERPQVVALELPVSLQQDWVRAVERLPEMSLIFYPEDDDATYVLVEPADPFTEAIRTGLERFVEAYRVYPQPRSEEISRHAAGIAWKLEGADPAASVFVVVSLNLLDPLLEPLMTHDLEKRLEALGT